MDQAQLIGIALGIATLVVIGVIVFFRYNIVICQPNELVIIAGRQRKNKDGSSSGYRVIRGGRGFKWPIMESVARLPLTTIPLELELRSALSAGMIPLNVVGRASVKLAGRPETGMEAAIERFLGKGPDAVMKTARQTLEGALRGAIAAVTPEQANAGRLEIAKQVAAAARADLQQLGIVLDFFQIQEISDSQGYLDALGKKQAAMVHRDARIAEATAEAEARKVSAEQLKLGRDAEITNELVIIEKENALRVRKSELEKAANEAFERAAVAKHIARAEEEITLQTRRVQLAEKQVEAETIVPAKAKAEADRVRAEGKAARIREDGKATAEAVKLMRAQWADGDARELFLIRLLPEITEQVTRVVSENLQVDKLTIVDSGNGQGLPNYVNNLTSSAVVMMEQVKNATGVDLAQIAEGPKKTGAELPKELG